MNIKQITHIFIPCCVVFLAGLILVLYPFFNRIQNSRDWQTATEEYTGTVAEAPASALASQWSQAEAMNARIDGEIILYPSPEQMEQYETALNPTGDGMIGYVEIGRIHVDLPIYHTATQEVLARGVGHLEWSSLPTGAPGTHTVLCAHNGLDGMELFERLPELKLGDSFCLCVLNKRFQYTVDQIMVVAPNEIASLFPVPEQCYCTLFTCAGEDDTLRLLVRGCLSGVEVIP